MTFSLDAKAIGLGIAAVVSGYLLMAVVLTIGVGALGETSRPLAIAMIVLVNLLTVLAGFTSAYFARSNPIIHGIIAGGLYLFVIFLITVFSSGVNSRMLASAVAGMLVVWLGAIFGRYVRTRREP
jgi:hypothetical protein